MVALADGSCGRERGERFGAGHRIVDDLDDVEPHRPFGERPGLVDAQDVDPGQHLDRRELLNDDVPLPEAEDRDHEPRRW